MAVRSKVGKAGEGATKMRAARSTINDVARLAGVC
jgi:hypothetical protein